MSLFLFWKSHAAWLPDNSLRSISSPARPPHPSPNPGLLATLGLGRKTVFLNSHSPHTLQAARALGLQKLKDRAPSPACPVVMGMCEPRASCLTHLYPFSIPSREGPPAPNLGKCKIHLSHQGCQNWSAFPTRMMLLLRTRERKGTVSILTEKAMAPQSSTLAWKIPWTEEPGRLQSMGARRVGHD